MKYVIVDGSIIVFSEAIRHSTFASMRPTSAGFIDIIGFTEYQVKFRCYGKSVSLGLKSAPEDSDLAERQLGGH